MQKAGWGEHLVCARTVRARVSPPAHRKGWGATTGPGMGGISMLLVERSEGLTTSKIKTSYSPAAGTAYVFYDNVKVPVGNLLGEENQGFRWDRDAL